MCGICGYLAPGLVPDRAALHRMRDVLAHRGPDGEGELEIGGESDGRKLRGWLGFRRLKILDLTPRADQPMANEDGSVAIVFNGEVYNFRDLRRELQARGFRFRSTGDTEVILRAYEAWGERFVERLDGMFALAVWDARAVKLVLARDRVGKKPLFYAFTNGRLIFGSEIKSILASPWFSPQPDVDRLAEFLTYGYVPHPATLLRGVHQVPPATVVVYDGLGLHAREYWSPLPDALDLRPSADVLADIAALLRCATERRLVADVPLGAFLSGGVDSSVVVGLMAGASSQPVQTFSIGFPEEPSYDESQYARAVAKHFRTKHTEFAVRVDAAALLDTLVWHHDQPFADSSAIPTYLVSQLAREHVTVVLNGDGGDEVFAGYERFAAAAYSFRIPRGVASFASHVVGMLPSGGYYDIRDRARRLLATAHESLVDRYHSWVAVASPDLVRALLAQPLRDQADPQRLRAPMDAHYERARHLPPLDRILYANFKTYLPDDLAVKMDRMSMANSVEARSPFLDTALIEYVSRLPARQRVGLRRAKPILRRVFFPLLPPYIWDRRKHGFGVPIGHWFRTSELGTIFGDEVLGVNARTAALLDRAVVKRLWNDHQRGKADHGGRLWTILTLERWLRSLDGPAPGMPTPSDYDAVVAP